MKTNISNLKQHLSENLQQVKNGKIVTIYERKTPIAKIVPLKPGKTKTLNIRQPTGKFIDMNLQINIDFDPAEYLTREDKWPIWHYRQKS